MKLAWAILTAACLVCLPTNTHAAENLLVIGGWDYGETMFDKAATGVGMSAKFVTTEDTEKVTVDQLNSTLALNSPVILWPCSVASGASLLVDSR